MDAQPKDFDETEIVGIPIANLDYDGIIDRVFAWSAVKRSNYVCICNVHSATASANIPSLRKALLGSALNSADGMPLVWMQHLLGHKDASRAYGPTLMLKTIARAQDKKLRMAFYGGHQNRLETLLGNLREEWPKIVIAEAISPPFRELTEEEDLAYTKRLNNAKADIIWVGIGCPKQEIWMMEHSPKIQGVMIGVGAAFDFHAGAVEQSPKFLQTIGMEWAYRLYKEPRRLFRRYLETNPIFIYRALKQLIQQKAGRMSYTIAGK